MQYIILSTTILTTCRVNDGRLRSDLPLSQLLQAELVAIQQGAGGEVVLLGKGANLFIGRLVVLENDVYQLVDIIIMLKLRTSLKCRRFN